MANTFELIASVTVGALGATTIDFNSIPGTYTDLIVKLSTRSTGGGAVYDQVRFKINGSTTSYSNRYLLGTGSSVSSGTYSTALYASTGEGNLATASTFTNDEIYIPNYAGSANKSVSVDSVQENNATAAYATLVAGLWSNTAAVTSLSFFLDTGPTFAQYSTAYLYGVKNA